MKQSCDIEIFYITIISKIFQGERFSFGTKQVVRVRLGLPIAHKSTHHGNISHD